MSYCDRKCRNAAYFQRRQARNHAVEEAATMTEVEQVELPKEPEPPAVVPVKVRLLRLDTTAQHPSGSRLLVTFLMSHGSRASEEFEVTHELGIQIMPAARRIM